MESTVSLALRNEWYPVLRGADLQGAPAAVQLFGMKFVVFRTSKGVHAFRDLCIHRGVPLSLGRVEGDEIVCPYHGWRYNGCGACTHIPSLPAGREIPAKAAAERFPCMELYGLVWVCPGKQPALSHPVFAPYLEGAEQGYKQVLMGPYEVAASAPRVIENFLDVAHLMFVHEGLLGDSRYPEIPEHRVHEENGVLRTDEIVVYQPDADGRGTEMNSHYIYEVFGPFTVALIKRNPENGETFHLFLIVQPVSGQQSRAFMIKARNYELDAPDEAYIKFQDTVFEQDLMIVENQKPELLPLDLQAELHLTSDRLSIAYRKRLKEWGVTFGTA